MFTKSMQFFRPNAIRTQTRKSYGRQMCTSAINSEKLLSAVADLEKFDIRLKNFPTMVFFGPQSSGKSSAIQSITGDYILPTDMKVATKKPTHITTIRSFHTKYKIGDREFHTAKEAANEIDRLNRNDHVQKIDVIVNSPNVHNSLFIDLPGLFSISDDDTNDEFRKNVKKLSMAYSSNANFIPIIVHAAPSDPATNSALKLISKINRREDAFGILTKIDMVKNQKTTYLEKMLNGTEYKLGHGYCAVVLPNDNDIERGISIEEKIVQETDYFKKNIHIRPAGVPTLRSMISDIQAKKITEHIPEILSDVNTQIDSLKNSQNFLNNLMNGDNKNLSRNLRVMVEKLVGSSQDRAEFENELKKCLRKEITEYLNNIETSDTKDFGDKSSDQIVSCDQLVRCDKYVNDEIVKNLQFNKSDVINHDSFKQLFSYGSGSPIFIDNVNLNETYDNEMKLGLVLSLIQPYINDNLGLKRIKWNRKLNLYFSKLLKDDTIHKIVKSVTVRLLLEFISLEAEFDNPINKKFAEYMINEIGNEAFESKIGFSITAMLNLEKRPNVSIFQILRYFVAKHPDLLKMPNSLFFTPRVHKARLEIFSEDWIEAYSKAVIDNITDNCYRNVAVNLLDKMVEKLLEMTIDMFHKENAAKEQNKVNEKMKKLLEIKTILLQAKISE